VRLEPLRPINGTPATLVGIVDDAPDEKTANERAIEEHSVPAAMR
jgi:hypothetical protein